MKIKNISIVPNILIHSRVPDSFQPLMYEFRLLINSLLRDPCTEVWVYSRIRKRFLQMIGSNAQNFFDTEIAAYDFLEDYEFLEFSLKLPEVNGITEQTLLYIYAYYEIGFSVRQTPLISKELQYLQNSKRYYVIAVVNFKQSFFDMFENWLPMHRAFIIDLIHPARLIDQHIHRDLLGVLRNPYYDRFKQYKDLKCIVERKWVIFIWNLK